MGDSFSAARNTIDRVTKISVLLDLAPELAASTTTAGEITKLTTKATTTYEIGSIQSLNVSERRDITPHFSLGGDKSEDPKFLVEGIARTKTLTCNYFALYKQSILQAFGRKAVVTTTAAINNPISTLTDQNYPFKIQEIISSPDGTQTKTRTYHECMISDYGATRDIGRGDVRILETATIVYRYVTSSLS